MSEAKLWFILVPCGSRMKHHYAWDERVRSIAGGLTVMRAAKGTWTSNDGEIVKERMIPVIVMCGEVQIEEIVDFTASHYKQKAILYGMISKEVKVKHF